MFDVYFRRRIAFLAVFGVLLTGGLRFATPSSGARPTVQYTVQPGDTLWSIASAGHAGDPRAGVAAIRSGVEGDRRQLRDEIESELKVKN